MSLLPIERFEFIRDVFAGHNVGYAFSREWSNAGDWMIHYGTHRVFAHYGIPCTNLVFERSGRDIDGHDKCTIIAWAGGGNMGCKRFGGDEPGCVGLRRQVVAMSRGRPIVVLPQSWSDPDPFPAHVVFAREPRSRTYAGPYARLAPDMALAYEPRLHLGYPTDDVGLFLRDDEESVFNNTRRDPLFTCKTPAEYLTLASQYRHIITDRLHFATAAMLAGRRTTLLPNRYHKNRGMWEAWLRDLGCEWADSPEAA